MYRRPMLTVVTMTFLLAAAWPAAAQERGTKEEAVTMVNAAYEHIKKVGSAKAMSDFNTDKAQWIKKDLYVFVFDPKGTFLAHGANEKLVGRDMSNLKDAGGKLIFPAMMETSAKGPGWVDYEWAHPQTKKVEGKSSYVRRLPEGQGVVGVGIYR